MRLWLILLLIFATTGCDAQLQKWQRERTVEHLGRLKSYRGHIRWAVGPESSEMDIWFQAPNRFLVVSKDGEVVRTDGTTMHIYDPKTQLHTIFKNLPAVSEKAGQQLIRDLFDQSMQIFTFSLGPLGKVADRPVIELRSKPKKNSIVESGEAQIFDEFSFPLKNMVRFNDGSVAQYEFTQIAFNEKFDLPNTKIPDNVFKVEWDFKLASEPPDSKTIAVQNLKHEKTLKHDTGAVLDYYRDGAQFLSVIRYKNLGRPPPPRGLPVQIGKQKGFLLPGPVSSTLTMSSGDTTFVYSSNLLFDDLIRFSRSYSHLE